MKGIEVCLPFIATILGVAYPVLLQVISNLGDKYDSFILVSVFKREIEYRFFKNILYFALGILLLYTILSITTYFNPDFFISQVEILIIIFTSILIISFFLLVRKILIYYNRQDLTVYLIQNIRNVEINDKLYEVYFNALSELLYWAIKNQNEKIAKTLSDYYYDSFEQFRENPEYIKNGYPEIYYNLIYLSTIELLRLKDNKLGFLELRIPGGIWLFGELAKNSIHEKTFIYLWRVLLKTIIKKRDDIIMYYWQNAFQYFTYSLKPIRLVFSDDFKLELNKVEVESRETERILFLEFNYVVCALLLFQKRYNCLSRIFNFTQSQPPRYVLFPSTMKGIFELFFKYSNTFNHDVTMISYKYNFPNSDGLGSDSVVLFWLRKYLAVLFLRQYTLTSYYTYQNYVAVPALPTEQGELKYWLSNIDFFCKTVLGIYENKSLMTALKFDYITDEWCTQNQKETPSEIFRKTAQLLSLQIESISIEQEPDDSKVEHFNSSTNRLISKTLDKYQYLRIETDIETDSDSWYLNGIQTIVSKDSFAENQGFTHINYDSFLAESYSLEINRFLAQQFYLKANQNYLLKQEDMFLGIDCLKIKEQGQYIIIAFDLNLSNFENVKGLDIEGKKYNEFSIVEISSSFELLHHSLMVIAKSDLPYFNYKKITPDIEQKYALKEVNSKYGIFASVIDLNQRTDLHNEINNEQESDLRKNVLLKIELPIEIKWKKKINAVLFKLHWIYEERGIPNKLKDIKSIING